MAKSNNMVAPDSNQNETKRDDSDYDDDEIKKERPHSQQNSRSNQSDGSFRAPSYNKTLIEEEFDQLISELENCKYSSLARKYTPWLIRKVDSVRFETLMALPILLNCGTIGVSTDCGVIHRNPCSTETKDLLMLFEHILTTIFVIEWWVRFWIYGMNIFKKPSDLFDTILVYGTGVVVVWVLPAIITEEQRSESSSFRMIQVLRAFRLMRICRVVRLLPMFKEMWLLVRGLAESFNTLLWSIIMIIFVLYIFGILAVELIGNGIDWTSETDLLILDAKHLEDRFTSLSQAMITLIQMMTLDSWTDTARPLQKIHPVSIYFFLLFIAIATFVLLNLVTAVIVNNALEISKKDEEQTAKQLMREKEDDLVELKRVFMKLDVDGGGTISREEFSQAFRLPAVATKLHNLEYNENQLEDLFTMLDFHNENELSVDAFVDGMARMKGEAKSKDTFAALQSLKRVEMRFQHLEKHLGIGLDDFESNSSKAKISVIDVLKKSNDKVNFPADFPTAVSYSMESRSNSLCEKRDDTQLAVCQQVPLLQNASNFVTLNGDFEGRIRDIVQRAIEESFTNIQSTKLIEEQFQNARTIAETSQSATPSRPHKPEYRPTEQGGLNDRRVERDFRTERDLRSIEEYHPQQNQQFRNDDNQRGRDRDRGKDRERDILRSRERELNEREQRIRDRERDIFGQTRSKYSPRDQYHGDGYARSASSPPIFPYPTPHPNYPYYFPNPMIPPFYYGYPHDLQQTFHPANIKTNDPNTTIYHDQKVMGAHSRISPRIDLPTNPPCNVTVVFNGDRDLSPVNTNLQTENNGFYDQGQTTYHPVNTTTQPENNGFYNQGQTIYHPGSDNHGIPVQNNGRNGNMYLEGNHGNMARSPMPPSTSNEAPTNDGIGETHGLSGTAPVGVPPFQNAYERPSGPECPPKVERMRSEPMMDDTMVNTVNDILGYEENELLQENLQIPNEDPSIIIDIKPENNQCTSSHHEDENVKNLNRTLSLPNKSLYEIDESDYDIKSSIIVQEKSMESINQSVSGHSNNSNHSESQRYEPSERSEHTSKISNKSSKHTVRSRSRNQSKQSFLSHRSDHNNSQDNHQQSQSITSSHHSQKSISERSQDHPNSQRSIKSSHSQRSERSQSSIIVNQLHHSHNMDQILPGQISDHEKLEDEQHEKEVDDSAQAVVEPEEPVDPPQSPGKTYEPYNKDISKNGYSASII